MALHGRSYNSEKGTNSSAWLGPIGKRRAVHWKFNSLEDGRAFAQNLYDEGADIVMPVAGPGARLCSSSS